LKLSLYPFFVVHSGIWDLPLPNRADNHHNPHAVSRAWRLREHLKWWHNKEWWLNISNLWFYARERLIEVSQRSLPMHLAELPSESELGEVDISRCADDASECGKLWLSQWRLSGTARHCLCHSPPNCVDFTGHTQRKPCSGKKPLRRNIIHHCVKCMVTNRL
jgi:hypothetical protein